MHVALGAKEALDAGHDHRHEPRGHDRQWYHGARGHFAPPPGDKAHDAPGEAVPKEERPERRADHTELAEMPAEFERTRAQVRALRDKAWARALEQRASDLFDEMESDTEHHELSCHHSGNPPRDSLYGLSWLLLASEGPWLMALLYTLASAPGTTRAYCCRLAHQRLRRALRVNQLFAHGPAPST
ncbi:hypothetical protein EMIHUDRAFT_209281 [Emiliania huxleyi CCMP1516]|uniref:Uncharacterized protein n=2 Tax=Emiliania huxleyi TaxID=2903 RepID=A0A0D3J5F8_EMIH1|nr:hypothetical protein EMIHUDRAFT_209281 [Emiliania huxleyi CCMP1516]EOD18743.1 hypothetical protein EMIHUDRAFT_209281 [Emiliania huxleyi CCMP1516]|eukprot:XP_005771172.1 hypothetical protein EMIHUDRAFT_209281 [Emiliania huxleyi CCMP1516]